MPKERSLSILSYTVLSAESASARVLRLEIESCDLHQDDMRRQLSNRMSKIVPFVGFESLMGSADDFGGGSVESVHPVHPYQGACASESARLSP